MGTATEAPPAPDDARLDEGHPGTARSAVIARTGFLVVALLLVAFTLRSPIAALPPIVGEVSAALSLSPAQAGLLTSVPLLCFALLTPLTSGLVGRIGPERAIFVALAAILAGQAIRSTPVFGVALAGAMVMGTGITIGNVAVPTVIARDFRHRAATLTGAYSATMNLGATVTMAATAPLAVWWGWQWALAGWGVLAVVAAVTWWRATRNRPGTATDGTTTPAAAPDAPPTGVGSARSARIVTVLLCLGFAVQSSSYYAMTAWLPTILDARLGLDPAAAGGIAAPLQLLAVAGAFSVPLAISRRVPTRWIALTITAAWLSLPLGLLLAPGAAALWAGLAGLAQGANFTLIVTLITRRAPTTDAARRSWSVVQTSGYASAAVAPTLVGALAAATRGWTVPLVGVVAALGFMGVVMAVATRPRGW